MRRAASRRAKGRVGPGVDTYQGVEVRQQLQSAGDALELRRGGVHKVGAQDEHVVREGGALGEDEVDCVLLFPC